MAAVTALQFPADDSSWELTELRERVRCLEARLAELQGVPPLRRDPMRSLTDTERKVAQLVGRGKSNQDVAAALFLSPKTVEWNLSKIYKKLHVSSRTELAAKLLRALP